MKQFFRAISSFLFSERGQIIFAVVLIVLIPAAVVWNTVSINKLSRNDLDYALRRQANLAEQILQSGLKDHLTEPDKLQHAVDDVKAASSDAEEIWAVDILLPKDGRFVVAASTVRTAIGTQVNDPLVALTWSSNKPYAYATRSSDPVTVNQKLLADDRAIKYWVIFGTMKDAQGRPVALVGMKLSAQKIEDAIQRSYTKSLVTLFVTVGIVILLLLVNTRLFQYTYLFRKLKEVDQMKDDFISVASHELRTPITGIRGYLSMILDGSMGQIPPAVKDSLTLVNQSAERLNGLVEDLLNVSRIEQGRLDLELQPVEPLSVIREVVTELLPMAKEKQLNVSYQTAESLPTLQLNRDRFKQVMVNLVGNGIKYTPQGSVTVQTETRDKRLRIKVADTGLGMSPTDMQRLFTKFYRIRTDQTQEIVGTGLGLWITKQIVEKMNGTIEVESIEGTGSQFIISFPINTGSMPTVHS